MTRLAGYSATGEEVCDTDVLSDEELAEDYSRIRRGDGGRHAFRAPQQLPRYVDEYGYDQDGTYYPELDGGVR